MKKIVAVILLLCMLLSISACAADKGDAPQEITTQELYDLSSVNALLEKHESVYVVCTWGGDVYEEAYYSKEYSYVFYDAEFYGLESDEAFFAMEDTCYYYTDDIYVQAVAITPDGLADVSGILTEDLNARFFSKNILNDIITSVTEKDGKIFVTSVSDQQEIDDAKAEGWIIDEDEYVIDAETREVLSVKGISVNEAGEEFESAINATYDVEIPEGMKKLVAYAQQTENMRTVTIVSNPGTEKEKTESIQVPKGMTVGLEADVSTDKTFAVYADAACTQTFETEPDVNSDVTVYIKWSE